MASSPHQVQISSSLVPGPTPAESYSRSIIPLCPTAKNGHDARNSAKNALE
jgi:hypothetical protein